MKNKSIDLKQHGLSKLPVEVTRTITPNHVSKDGPNPGDTLPGYWGISERSIWNVMRQGGKWDDQKLCIQDKKEGIFEKNKKRE